MGVPVTPLCLFRIRHALHFARCSNIYRNALSSNLPALQPNSHSLLYPPRSANWHLFVLTLPWSQRKYCQFFSHISVNKKVWVGLFFFSLLTFSHSRQNSNRIMTISLLPCSPLEHIWACASCFMFSCLSDSVCSECLMMCWVCWRYYDFFFFVTWYRHNVNTWLTFVCFVRLMWWRRLLVGGTTPSWCWCPCCWPACCWLHCW